MEREGKENIVSTYYSIRICDLKGLTDGRTATAFEIAKAVDMRERMRPSLKQTERNDRHNHHATVAPPEFNLWRNIRLPPPRTEPVSGNPSPSLENGN